jgi:hypothetical protein
MQVVQPQSTYRGRVEIGAVYLPAQMDRTLQLTDFTPPPPARAKVG